MRVNAHFSFVCKTNLAIFDIELLNYEFEFSKYLFQNQIKKLKFAYKTL